MTKDIFRNINDNNFDLSDINFLIENFYFSSIKDNIINKFDKFVSNYILSNLKWTQVQELIKTKKETLKRIFGYDIDFIVNFIVENNYCIYNENLVIDLLELNGYSFILTKANEQKISDIALKILKYSNFYWSSAQRRIGTFLGLDFLIEKMNNDKTLYNTFTENRIFRNFFTDEKNIDNIAHLVYITYRDRNVDLYLEDIVYSFIRGGYTFNDGYASLIERIYSELDIKSMFNRICTNLEYGDGIIQFCNFFRCIFTEKEELKYVKKLKTKRFCYLSFWQKFYNEYNFKYESNKNYLNSLIFIGRIKE